MHCFVDHISSPLLQNHHFEPSKVSQVPPSLDSSDLLGPRRRIPLLLDLLSLELLPDLLGSCAAGHFEDDGGEAEVAVEEDAPWDTGCWAVEDCLEENPKSVPSTGDPQYTRATHPRVVHNLNDHCELAGVEALVDNNHCEARPSAWTDIMSWQFDAPRPTSTNRLNDDSFCKNKEGSPTVRQYSVMRVATSGPVNSEIWIDVGPERHLGRSFIRDWRDPPCST